jgi:ferritin-like protein
MWALTKKASDDGEKLPSEIYDVEKFVEISSRAEYCAVKRLKDVVKLKLRTPKTLYTLKVEPVKAAEIINKLQCEIREI